VTSPLRARGPASDASAPAQAATLEELRSECRARGLKGIRKLIKADLVAVLAADKEARPWIQVAPLPQFLAPAAAFNGAPGQFFAAAPQFLAPAAASLAPPGQFFAAAPQFLAPAAAFNGAPGQFFAAAPQFLAPAAAFNGAPFGGTPQYDAPGPSAFGGTPWFATP